MDGCHLGLKKELLEIVRLVSAFSAGTLHYPFTHMLSMQSDEVADGCSSLYIPFNVDIYTYIYICKVYKIVCVYIVDTRILREREREILCVASFGLY